MYVCLESIRVCYREICEVPLFLNCIFLFFMFELKSCIRGSPSSTKPFVIIVGKSSRDLLTPKTLKLVRLR